MMHVSVHARDIIDGSRVSWVVTLSLNNIARQAAKPTTARY